MRAYEADVDRWDGFNPESAAAAAPVLKASIPTADIVARSRSAFLTADGQSATLLEQEALLGTNDLVEASFLDRCFLVRDCVGRLRFQTPQGRAFATAFLIAPGILLTNQHVFPNEEAAREAIVQFDYRYDVAGQLPAQIDEYALDPASFFVTDADLDFAAVAVAPRSMLGRDIAGRGHLRLIAQTGKADLGEFVTIIQHPDGAAMQIALRENQIIRLEPDEPFIWYHADTAHGSSGSAVLNDSLQLVALHSSGRIRRDEQGRFALKAGGFANTLDGLGEADVIWEANVGFRISRIAPALLAAAQARSPAHAAVIEAAMRGGDVLSNAVARLGGAAPDSNEDGPVRFDDVGATVVAGVKEEQEMAESNSVGGSGLVIPLQLHVSLSGGVAGVTAALPTLKGGAAAALEAEAFPMRIPIIYDDLDSRPGFNDDFLDLADGAKAPVPRLTAAGEALAAPLLDGSGHELKYGHFSVWMNKERRLAFFTAANVDWRARQAVVDGKSTTRKPLAGFPEHPEFAEQWVTDARIAADHQLPDLFYTDDRKAFDKGHIVRRDDVCWGRTYAEIQMANGDTYHVTNCSPQTKAFNQGQHGVENWGDLESHVEKATKRDSEKAILYAGPVFGRDDRWFRGVDDRGAVRIQIPTRFWKIVVVKGEDGGAEAYGFVLKQDVTAITEKEFVVTEEWKGELTRISEIEDMLRGWVSLEALQAHDQYDRVKPDG